MAQLAVVTTTTDLPARIPGSAGRVPTADEQDAFRGVQRLAYRAAEEVGASLQEGTTERQAAKLLRTWLQDHGADDWFHLPFAWFGDRAAFRNFRAPLQFLPTNRRLEPGMGYILDAAPVLAGATADIG